jgi:hypothetical protein
MKVVPVILHALSIIVLACACSRNADEALPVNDANSKADAQPLQHATNIISTEAAAVGVAEAEVKRVRDWKDVESKLLTFNGTQWTIMTFRKPFQYRGHMIATVSTNGRIISLLPGK